MMGEVNAGLLVAVTGVLLGTALTVTAFLGSTTRSAGPDRTLQPAAESVCGCSEVVPSVPAPAAPVKPMAASDGTAATPSVRATGPCAAASCKDRAREASSAAG